MQEEVDQKTIALAVKTGKLTAQVLQAAIQKYLAARQKGTGKARHGQQNLRQLKKDGSALSNIEITDANIGLFKPCAKKYDIDFESGAADRPARCPCAGVPAMAGPANPLDGCLDCSL